MKKIMSILMVAVALMMAAPAHAQILKFGVKGGLNLSKVSFSKSDLEGDNQTGWFIGPMAEFTLPIVGLGVDAAALFSQSKMENEHGGKATLKTIEVPVNLKWSFGLGSTLGIYLAAGPQFGFNIGDKSLENILGKWNLKKSNTSFNVGAGLKLIKHLQVGVNYNFALSKNGVYEPTTIGGPAPEYNAKNNSWQVSLAYIF